MKTKFNIVGEFSWQNSNCRNVCI